LSAAPFKDFWRLGAWKVRREDFSESAGVVVPHSVGQFLRLSNSAVFAGIILQNITIALRVPLYHADSLPDHEPAGPAGFSATAASSGAGQGERATDRQRFAAVALSHSSTLKLKPGSHVRFRNKASTPPNKRPHIQHT
jgi:hypothetical protein